MQYEGTSDRRSVRIRELEEEVKRLRTLIQDHLGWLLRGAEYMRQLGKLERLAVYDLATKRIKEAIGRLPDATPPNGVKLTASDVMCPVQQRRGKR